MKHKNFLLVCIVVLPILLSACGGGSSSSSTPAANSASTINGITVPPAPDSVANNATLAGVDSNNNGVRDDVERLIAITNSSTSQQRKTTSRISAAMKAQIALTATIQNSSDYRKYECNVTDLGAEDGVVLHHAIFNTKERRELYKNSLPAAGTSYTLNIRPDGLGIQDSVCTSDAKPYNSNE